MTTAASSGIADPIYSTTPPIATTVQDGSASVFSKGWNSATGYGIHLDFFSTPPKMQFNASASQPIASQPDPSAVQLMGAQQDASATQLNAQGAWRPQQMAQANASAPLPVTPQQRLVIVAISASEGNQLGIPQSSNWTDTVCQCAVRGYYWPTIG